MAKTLEVLRSEIDKIDEDIKNLLLKRKLVVEKVLEYKNINQIEIYSNAREDEILKLITQDIASDDPFLPYLKNIFKVVVSENRNYMLKIK